MPQCGYNPSFVYDIIQEWEQNKGGFNSYYNTMGKVLPGVLAEVNVKSTLDHENQPQHDELLLAR